jgi:hypothetical protein
MGEPDPLRMAIREKIAFLEGALNLNVAIGTHEDKLEAYLGFLSNTSENGFMEESIQFETWEDMYEFLDKVELLIRISRAQQRGE